MLCARGSGLSFKPPTSHAQVDEMEEVAVRISKSVAKLGRELKAWPVWGWIKVGHGQCGTGLYRYMRQQDTAWQATTAHPPQRCTAQSASWLVVLPVVSCIITDNQAPCPAFPQLL